MAIRRLAGENADYLRIRTLLANVIVCQLMPKGAVKGGSALKMRFGDKQTRATTDLDAARADNLESFIEEFGKNLDRGWNGFSARLIQKKPAAPKDVPAHYVMQPFEVKLSYQGSAWCTVAFELGHDEIGDADNPDLVEPVEASRILQALGFPEPSPIPLMPLHYQIAQKLHGVSEPCSKRAHDLIDLQLIVSNADIDFKETLLTCKRLFSYRQMHQWPPVVVKNEHWAEIYAEQSMGLNVLPGVSEAIDWANNLISQIDNAG